MKPYEIIEHTADIGIRVKGKDPAELFKDAGLAMFDIIAKRKPGKDTRLTTIPIEQTADNLEELFINWLNELLSLSATKEIIFTDFQMDSLNEHSLKAHAIGEDVKNYEVDKEIKAATYHQLRLEKINSGWQVEVILDV